MPPSTLFRELEGFMLGSTSDAGIKTFGETLISVVDTEGLWPGSAQGA